MRKSVGLMTVGLLLACSLSACVPYRDYTSPDSSDMVDQITENEQAIKAYQAALQNEISIWDAQLGEVKLRECRFPSDVARLDECKIKGTAVLDMDGDGAYEYVIQSDLGEHIVLHYEDGKVYCYSFDFRNFYYLNTDGSFAWNGQGQDFSYGESKLIFNGANYSKKALWSVVNDGQPNARYYVDGKQVSKQELTDYLAQNKKEKAVFAPIHLDWQNKILLTEAIEIAKDHWERFDIEKNQYTVAKSANSTSPDSVYVITLNRWSVNHYTTIEQVWIDKTTGEIISPYAPVTEQEALGLAKLYWAEQISEIGKDSENRYALMIAKDALGSAEHYRVFLLSWSLNGARPTASYEVLINRTDGQQTQPEQNVLIEFDADYVTYTCNQGYGYAILDQNKNAVHSEIATVLPRFWTVDNHILRVYFDCEEYKYSTLFYDTDSGDLSPVYEYAIAAGGGLVAYLEGALDARKVIVKSIFDDGYRQVFEPELAAIPMPIEKASLSADNLYLTYHIKGADAIRHTMIPLRLLPDTDRFADYPSILALAAEICTAIPYYDDYLDYSEIFGIHEQHKQTFDELFVSLMTLYPTTGEDGIRVEYRQAMGYAIKDLNGDGVYELILLRNDYEIIAIFTTKDQKPVLLDRFWNRYHCVIDENGLIHTLGSSGADVHEYAVYRIDGSTGTLAEVAKFGLDGHEWVDGVAVQLYYQTIDGEKINITEQEYKALYAQHRGFLKDYVANEYTRDVARVSFDVLPYSGDIDHICAVLDNYKDLIAQASPMDAQTLDQLKKDPLIAMYRGLIDSFAISSPYYYGQITHFALVDADGDGVLDLLLRTPAEIFVLSYEDVQAKKLQLSLWDKTNGILLEDGSVFAAAHCICCDDVDIYLTRDGKTIGYADNIGKSNAYFYYLGNKTEQEWLQEMRALSLTRAYWYNFTDENVQTYLPCEQPAPFTHLTYSSYESLLDVIYALTESYNLRKLEPHFEGKLEILYDCSTEQKRQTYLSIKDLVRDMYPKALGASYLPDKAIGYAFRDLNGDGTDELMLFNGGNFRLDAVFTLVNGVPARDYTDYGFEQLDWDKQLAYWEQNEGIDLLPLFPDSDHFDLIKEEYEGK